eukprot:PhF_6_TR40234/c0_g2_i1/m.59821
MASRRPSSQLSPRGGSISDIPVRRTPRGASNTSIDADSLPLTNIHQFDATIRALDVIMVSKDHVNAWCADFDGTIRVRAVPGGLELHKVERKDKTFCLCITACEGNMWCGLSDGWLRVYDGIACNMVFEFLQHDGAILSIYANSTHVYTGGADWKILEWDAFTFEYGRQFSGHGNSIKCLVTTDTFLFSGSDDGTIKLWDIHPAVKDTAKDGVVTLRGHARSVLCLDILPQLPMRLWTGSEDTTIRVWDMNNMQCISVLDKHRAPVTAILHDENKVWSCAKDGMMYVWNASTNQCLQTLAQGMQLSTRYIMTMKRVLDVSSWKIWSCGSDGVVTCLTTECGIAPRRKMKMYDDDKRDDKIKEMQKTILEYVARIQTLEEGTQHDQDRISLAKQMDALRDKNTELHEKSVLAEVQAAQAGDRLSMAEDLLNSTRHRMKVLEGDLEAATKERDALRDDQKKRGVYTSDLSDARKMLDESAARNKELQGHLEELANMVEQGQREIARRDDTINNLSVEVAKLRGLNEEGHKKDDMIRNLKVELEAAKSVRAPTPTTPNTTRDAERMKQDLTRLQNRVADLEKDCDEQYKARQEAEQKLQDATWANEKEMRKVLQELDSVKKDLAREKQSQSPATPTTKPPAGPDMLAKTLDELAKYKQRALDAEKQVNDLCIRCAELEGDQGANEEWKSRYDHLLDEKKQAETSLKRALDAANLKARHDAEKISILESDLDHAHTSYADHEARAKGEYDALLAKFRAESAKGLQLEGDLHESTRALEDARNQHQLTVGKLEKEMELLKKKLANETDRANKAEEFAAEAETQSATYGRTKRDLELMQAKLQSANDRVVRAEGELHTLQQSSEADMEALRKEVAKLQQQGKGLNAKVNELSRENERLEEELRTRSNPTPTLAPVNETPQIKRELAREKERTAALEAEKAQLQTDYETLDTRHRKDVAALQNKLKEESARAGELESELFKVKDSAQEAQLVSSRALDQVQLKLKRESQRVKELEDALEDAQRQSQLQQQQSPLQPSQSSPGFEKKLQDALREADENKEKLENSLQEALRKGVKLERENASLTTRLQSAVTRGEDLDREAIALHQEMDSLKSAHRQSIADLQRKMRESASNAAIASIPQNESYGLDDALAKVRKEAERANRAELDLAGKSTD